MQIYVAPQICHNAIHQLVHLLLSGCPALLLVHFLSVYLPQSSESSPAAPRGLWLHQFNRFQDIGIASVHHREVVDAVFDCLSRVLPCLYLIFRLDAEINLHSHLILHNASPIRAQSVPSRTTRLSVCRQSTACRATRIQEQLRSNYGAVSAGAVTVVDGFQLIVGLLYCGNQV